MVFKGGKEKQRRQERHKNPIKDWESWLKREADRDEERRRRHFRPMRGVNLSSPDRAEALLHVWQNFNRPVWFSTSPPWKAPRRHWFTQRQLSTLIIHDHVLWKWNDDYASLNEATPPNRIDSDAPCCSGLEGAVGAIFDSYVSIFTKPNTSYNSFKTLLLSLSYLGPNSQVLSEFLVKPGP